MIFFKVFLFLSILFEFSASFVQPSPERLNSCKSRNPDKTQKFKPEQYINFYFSWIPSQKNTVLCWSSLKISSFSWIPTSTRAPSSDNELEKSNKISIVDVPPGKTFYQLAHELEAKKIISSAKLFKALIWLHGRPALRQGEYEISSDMSLWKIFNQFKDGKARVFKVSFPEGFNHYEMAETLKNHNYSETEQFLNLVWDKNFIKKTLNKNLESLEGYLFPDTYYLTKYMPAEDLIKNMTQKFLIVYQGLNKAPLEMSLTDHQVVILASIVEKETGASKERPLIAGVFFNRLKKDMKLQTDPTILYSLYLTRGFDIVKNIKKEDILFDSPYNTYVVKGLPPNPIANPGQESLQAVFKPEESDYLYFVSKNDGSHKFSKTYEEHEKAVYKYQIKKK